MGFSRRTIRVYERNPRWLPELQRQLAGEMFEIFLSHSAGDVFQKTSSIGSCDITLFDFNSAPADCLQTFRKMLGQNAKQPVILIHSEEQASLEWSLRELGITHFLTDKATGEELAHLCRWVSRKETR